MRVKQIQEDLSLIRDMEALSEAYEEISVMKMRQVRQAVLSTRVFMESVSDVFYHVKKSYKTQIERLMKKNKNTTKPLTFSTLPNNGKDVIVLLSANTRLYGTIIADTFQAFFAAAAQANADVVIVGLLGKILYEEHKGKKQYTYFQIPDVKVTAEDLQPLIAFVAPYQNVKVFYGKFENVIVQKAAESTVSGQENLVKETATTTPTADNFSFFFEPSLETILHFFETQVFSSLFQQTVHEHELARYASRIKAMEEAITHIGTKKRALLLREKIMQKSIEHAKQLSALSGMSLWQK